jgi:2-methylcitrate dehydratase PrpD
VADEPVVQARARALLLDTLGCAVAGIADPIVAALFREAEIADPGAIAFPGTDARLSAAAFAACIGAASCWHEACEGLPAAHGRPGLHAIAAVLGPALLREEPLGALLDAIVAGYELGGRLGMVLRIRPGMHVDGTWGSFAAVAACCRLAGDTPEMALSALNHAACHMPFSLYRPITFGSTARNAYVGHGAMHGVASAYASRAGLGGPPGSLADMAAIALGTVGAELLRFPAPGYWLLMDGYLKPFPAVRHVHYGATTAIEWHLQAGASPDRISAIKLHVYQEALTYCANRAPKTAIQAQFSLSYGVAAALLNGRLDPQAYNAASLTDPALCRLEALIELVVDPTMSQANQRGCKLEVVADGKTWTGSVDTIPGDPAMPLPREAVLAKFMSYASPVLGRAHATNLSELVLNGGLDRPLNLQV